MKALLSTLLILFSAPVLAQEIQDFQVADDITANRYLPLIGGTMTGEIIIDDLGAEFTPTDAITDCTSYSATGGGIFYDDSEGILKKCQDNVLTDLDTAGVSESTTVSDTSTIDLTETGDDISGIVVADSIGAAQLDAATDASLALADSATQPADIDTFAELDAIVADEALANISGTPTANQVSLFSDANTIAGNPALAFTDPYLVVGGQSAGSFNFHVANFGGGTIGITENLNGHTAADGLSINYTNGGASIVNAETGQLDLGTDSLIRLSIESDGDIDFNAGDLILDEKAALSSTPAAGKGYFYVKNTVPSTAIFVDDTGSEITLGAGGASQLTDLTDVGTAAVTNRFALMADGVDYDGRALVEADISDLAHTTDTDTQLSQEQVEDFAGALVTDGTGTHTGIAITYQDATGDVDMVVDHDAANNFVANEHIDWTGASAGTIDPTNYVDNDTDTQLTQEQVEDFAGGMDLGTETRVSFTYNDTSGNFDIVVDDMNQTSGDIDHDATTNFLAAEHVDWAGASAGTIHASNYVDNDTTYSVGDGGLTTNDFTAADHTKLDGIETGADVTDTDSVTSSGALMDSEVTNLAQVKAFDTTDYATSAQGSTADAALPKAGGTMTGELVIDDLGIEATATDAITDCSGFSATSGGLFYDDSEGKWKKCEDNVLSDMDTTGGGGGGGNLTTKGDLEVYTTSQTRLAVGTDDQVLKADSSAAAGVAWADLYGGVGFMKRSSTSTSAIGLGTALTLDTAVTDTTGGDVTWSAGNASRLTIATAGTYEICGYVTITDGSTQRQSSTLKIYKNGTAVTDARGTAYIRNYGLSWDWWVLELACTPFVAAVNDYFEVYAGENASTTLAWANNGAPTFVGSESEIWIKRLDAVSGFAATPLDQVFVIPSSDEGTDLTTGTDKIKFRMPYSVTISEVRASMGTAPTGSVATFDINESGTSILSTKLSIDATEKTSTTAATAAVISDSTLADDSEITVDIDAIGSTTAGKGLKIYLIVE